MEEESAPPVKRCCATVARTGSTPVVLGPVSSGPPPFHEDRPVAACSSLWGDDQVARGFLYVAANASTSSRRKSRALPIF
jgi:hypothetical protein